MAEAPSPFLPGTNIQHSWDSTSLGLLKECPRKYQYSIIEGWRSQGSNIHLTFGSIYHSSLELYDKLRLQPLNHDEALQQVVVHALTESWIDQPNSSGETIRGPWTTDDPNKNRDTLLRSIIWYLDQFGDNDTAKTITLENGKPAVELSFKFELDWGPNYSSTFKKAWDENSTELKTLPLNELFKSDQQNYVLCGHLDRIVDYAGSVFVMDRKTTKTTLSPTYFNQYEPDNQMSLYSFASKVIFNSPVKGVIIDAAQVAVGFTRFDRGVTYRTNDQINEWLGDMKIYLRQAEEYALANYWPMNDKSCFMCQFRRVCSRDPAVRDITLRSEFKKEYWNPLIAR